MDSFDPLVSARSANADEYDRVIELTNEMYASGQEDEFKISSDTKAKEWLEDSVKSGAAEAAVAFDSATNAIVASGVGVVQENSVGNIRWMSTTEDFRGYGVGEQILNHLMSWFKEKGILEVQLRADDKAAEFYRQHGFAESDGMLTRAV
jgi:GNAT superfamily N-acetyltransferase